MIMSLIKASISVLWRLIKLSAAMTWVHMIKISKTSINIRMTSFHLLRFFRLSSMMFSFPPESLQELLYGNSTTTGERST
jgi:hypothetical protein